QNVDRLYVAWRASLPNAADGSPVYVASVRTKTAVRDLVIVNTINGQLVAIDASSGQQVWQTPRLPGPRWTTSSPAVDPKHEYVYGYSLDGYVHRYDMRD